MINPNKLNKSIFRLLSKYTLLLSSVSLIMIGTTAAIAHEVRTSQEVGGTIHIEPNDRPIAGKKSTIWVALTKRGGEIIPYAKCNCRMDVRSLSDRSIKFTVANPLAIIERYLGLPSLEVTFPQVGRYELKLSGSPRDGEDFAPFELTFTTNVGK
jgi:hypothetical protein